MKVDQLGDKEYSDDVHRKLNPKEDDHGLTFNFFFLRQVLGYQVDKHKHCAHFKQKVRIDETSEIFVVRGTDTIVKPVAMMIEFFAAPVAGATVFSSFLDVGVADVAV